MVDNSKLFEKVVLNNKVEVPSRLSIAPLTLFSSNEDGTISDGEAEYLRVRATGVGLYILGATAVSQEGITFPCQPLALTEKDIPSIAKRAQIIKDQGALAINQIHHGGSKAEKKLSGLSPVVPTAEVPNEELKKDGKLTDETECKELTDAQINKIIDDFANACEISLKAGCDGIEIHGANNFLLQQFYSPHTNKRTDNWGGSDEKRMNFCLKIVDACVKVKEKNNKPDFIIGYRLSPEEPFEDGLTMTETLKLVRALVLKPIQFIHISQHDFFQKAHRGEGAGTERLKLIHEITKGKVALVGVGGLRTDSDFKKAAESGFCEFIASGVASILNKSLGILLKEKKGDKIVPKFDSTHPENYSMPPSLWDLCIKWKF